MASSYTVAYLRDVAVVHCSGVMVAGECDELRALAIRAIEQTGKIVLDLTDTAYMDSTGLGLLASLCMSARRRAGDVKLAGVNAQIREVLEITMLGRIFKTYATAQAAAAAFSAGRDSLHLEQNA